MTMPESWQLAGWSYAGQVAEDADDDPSVIEERMHAAVQFAFFLNARGWKLVPPDEHAEAMA